MHGKDDNKNGKRNLPSWMSSRQDGTSSQSNRQVGNSSQDEGRLKKATGHVEEQSRGNGSEEAGQAALQFSKLMEGVIFVLSGFVNPERGIVRSQALEMGAQYRPDWTSDCTLLVCAFPNTPKFRQVEEDCGTIVSKNWISDCYNQRKLVEIETYLMHVGKPWRKNEIPFKASQDQENVVSGKLQDQPERRKDTKLNSSGLFEGPASCSLGRRNLSPSQVKEWATKDLAQTVSWLEIQEEKPEPDEVKKIAAEGIITCLQDALAALEQNQDIGWVIEQWKFVPHVVKKLAELEAGQSRKGSLKKEDLSKLAINCKQIYEAEFDNLFSSPVESKKLKGAQGDIDAEELEVMPDDTANDSDSTIEMTEEEIDLACKGLAYPENF